ncbi:putative transcriptional regulator [Escherichia coli DEC5D]|nr:putative transcriptional regulator [Escherichia coli DEC5D]
MGFEERRVFRRYKGTGEQNTSGNATVKKNAKKISERVIACYHNKKRL